MRNFKKIALLTFTMFFVFTGCQLKIEQKDIRVIGLRESAYEVEMQQFEELQNIKPSDIEINVITESSLLGSVLDRSGMGTTFTTKFLFSIEKGKMKVYDYPKATRIIDFTISNGQLYYLNYKQTGNQSFASLYRYVDGNQDMKIAEIKCEGGFAGTSILEYKDSFLILNQGNQKLEVYSFSDDAIHSVFTKSLENDFHAMISSFLIHSDVLYGKTFSEKENRMLAVDLQTMQGKEYPTHKKFYEIIATDDYIVMLDDNGKESVYDKEMNLLWESNLKFDLIQKVKYANKNTVVYKNTEDDFFIRNYDTYEVYEFSALFNDELSDMIEDFSIVNDTILFFGTADSPAPLYTISIHENRLNQNR